MNEPARNTEELLAALRGPVMAMRDSLGGVRMKRPAEAIIAAGRSRRQRALALRAAAAAVVAASATVWVTASVGQPTPHGGGIQAYTASYVIGQVRSALANNDMVMQTTYSFSPQFPSITQWSYDGNFSMIQSGSAAHTTAPGTPTAYGHGRPAAGTAVRDGRPSYVVVDYGLREWSPETRPGVTPAGCSTRLDIVESGGPVDWPSYLRQALSCGEFRYSGYGRVDGHSAIKLTASVRGPASWAQGTHPDPATPHVDAALYVDPSTYVPMRVIWSNTGQSSGGARARGTISEDVRLLPPTPANVAKATVSIPAGFRKVRDGTFGGPVFQFFG